jgi:1-deoxy-D-xylulose-5-phosphate synthase
VLEALAEARIEIPVLTLGLADTFSEHGDPGKLLAMYGLDAAGIEQSIQRRFGATPTLLPSPVRNAVGL